MRLLDYETFESPATLCSLTLPTQPNTDLSQTPGLLLTLAWKGGYILVVDGESLTIQELSWFYPSGLAFGCNMAESAFKYFAKGQYGCPAYQDVLEDLKLETKALLTCEPYHSLSSSAYLRQCSEV